MAAFDDLARPNLVLLTTLQGIKIVVSSPKIVGQILIIFPLN